MRKSIISGIIIFFAGCMIANSHGAEPAGFLSVTGPCSLEFPKDHGPHPGYRTEWWYYTGNLQSPSGEKFGF